MPYTVQSVFSPAHELQVSLSTFLNKKMHKRTELGGAWVEETRSRLTPGFREELSGMQELEHCGFLKLLAWISPEQTIGGFLGWLEQRSPGDIYELLSPWVNVFPVDLGGVRDRSVALLSEWDRQYFSAADPDLVGQLQREAQSFRTAIPGREPAELIEQTTNGLVFEPVPRETTVLMIPQYHSQPVALVDDFNGLIICLYASNTLPVPVEGEPAPGMYRMIRALSDKTRLRILHFLKEKPRMYMEIVQHLGMSKSTVYEHMLTLRSSGLVRAHSTWEKSSVFYSLRKEAFDLLRKDLGSYLD